MAATKHKTRTLEEQRVLSEIQKNRAERDKIRREQRRPWLKFLVAGLAVGALTTAWFTQYAQSFFEAKKLELEKVKWENQITLYRIQDQLYGTEKSLLMISQQYDSLLVSQKSSERNLIAMRTKYTNLSKQYVSLSQEKSLTEAERDNFASMAQDAIRESEALVGEIAVLKLAQERSTLFSRTILRGLEAINLAHIRTAADSSLAGFSFY